MLSFLAAAALEVADVRLERLVEIADQIVVARVDAVATFPRTPSPSRVAMTSWDSSTSFDVARATILRSLKGTSETGSVCFLASGTWTCDDSDAEEGETVFLFLVGSKPVGRAATVEPERFDAFTTKQVVYRIAWSGLGRMPIDTVEGRSLVEWTRNVHVPTQLDRRAVESPTHRWLVRAPLDELTICVQTYLGLQDASLVHATCRLAAHSARDWDLRIATDGRACMRYYARGSSGPDDWQSDRSRNEEWIGTIGETEVAQLRARLLASAAPPLPDVVGQPGSRTEERVLSVFGEPKPAGGKREATATRLLGERDASSTDARAERAWVLWSEIERLAADVTAASDRPAARK